MNCLECGAEIESSWKHCSGCGALAPKKTNSSIAEEPDVSDGLAQGNQTAKSTTNPLVVLLSLVMVLAVAVFIVKAMQAPKNYQTAELFPSQENIVSDSDPSAGEVTENTDVVASNCGKGGEPIPEIENSCQYPDGSKFWLEGTAGDFVNHAGGGAFYIQYYAANVGKKVRDFYGLTELVDEGGASYEPLSLNDPFNPQGLCSAGDASINARLNPHAYTTIAGCFSLPNGLHITGVRLRDSNSGRVLFSYKLDQVLSGNN